MPEQAGGEKTLPASPRKIQRAREKGNVAKSQDLSAATTLMVSLVALLVLGPTMMDEMQLATYRFFRDAATMPVEIGTMQRLTTEVLWILARITLPFMLILMLAGTAINIAQFGLLMTTQAIKPKLEKLNPITGFQRFFSIRSFVELIKSILKLTVVCYIVYLTVRGRWYEVLTYSFLPPEATIDAIGGIVALIWFRVALAVLVLGLLDFAFQKWKHQQELRMTSQEAREEVKEMEGDPRVRQRIRQVQRQAAMQRMMGEVPEADVVITNPTTFAVALRYDAANMDSPVVVAKGARLIAERIREIAVENDVPIVEKPPLARSLYRTMEVGQTVPESLFQAVAEVLRYVYQIDRRVAKQRERAPMLRAIQTAGA
jgi:flagellar biosynthetic protein FlhB